jgi:hypothetical protein
LLRISWHDVQKVSVLVTSSAVLNAPQKMMPAMKPAITRTPRLNTELGRRSTPQISQAKANARLHNGGLGGEVSTVVIAAAPARRA